LNACPYRATEILHRRPLIVEFYRHDNYSDEAGLRQLPSLPMKLVAWAWVP
jgi:hypothetical protein